VKTVILHIWGPIAIHAYGFFIALGTLLFLFFIKRDARFSSLNLQKNFDSIFLLGVIAILGGGRVLHVWREYDTYNSWTEWFFIWEPGYAVLGSTLAVVVALPIYLYYKKIPILSFLDLVATYIPLLESVGRVGCFFAGCCFGCITDMPWGVRYTDALSLAPLHLSLHPTQLYSAVGSLCIFLCMYLYARFHCTIPGQQVVLFLTLAALERFVVDFWRGDREILLHTDFIYFSFHQLLALFIIGMAFCFFIGLHYCRKQK
jgi:phosphatidylglycerol:prolipoprotein diacylglycerol transferase